MAADFQPSPGNKEITRNDRESLPNFIGKTKFHRNSIQKISTYFSLARLYT
jgi:hypothetical protein